METPKAAHAAHEATPPSIQPTDSSAGVGNDYEIPAPEPFTTFGALKDRIKLHYELASDYYYSIW